MIGLGIIGYGYWGPNLVRNFVESMSAQMVAVPDSRSDRLAIVTRRYPTVEVTADAFFALLGAMALYDATGRVSRLHRPLARVALVGVLVLVSTGWVVRASGLPYLLRETAFTVRSDWAVIHRWLEAQRIELKTSAARALVDQLRNEALTSPLPHSNIGRADYVDYLDLN